MPIWSPASAATHPQAWSDPDRFVLKRLGKESFLAIDQRDQSLMEVRLIEHAHHFLTHEAAVRAAGELQRIGRGPVDVIKVEGP